MFPMDFRIVNFLAPKAGKEAIYAGYRGTLKIEEVIIHTIFFDHLMNHNCLRTPFLEFFIRSGY